MTWLYGYYRCQLCHDTEATRLIRLSDGYGKSRVCDDCFLKLTERAS